ncbi:MAG: hypothetical protein BWY64_02995 [bacterium ADurb.Bin363]|nr:MAG: hypothetical protein BWY64_02995 [bacterium ADurb.Bin363]
MKNVALVYFLGNEVKWSKRISLMSIFRKLKKLFAFKVNPLSVNKVAIDESLTIHMVKLPYTLKELEKAGRCTKNKVNRCLSRICTEISIDKCFVPADLTSTLEKGVKSGLTGNLAFKVLAADITRYICAQKGFSLRDVDVAIIQGDNAMLPYMVIKQLSPNVKFITLVTDNRDLIEKKIEEVCYETGLSVRITKDAASVLNNSDVVINYGNLRSFRIINKIDSKAIIINYGELKEDKFASDNEVIFGMDIGLGDRYTVSIEDDLLSFYSNSEIAEIILVNKAGIMFDSAGELAENSDLDKFIKMFYEKGFYVKGIYNDRILSKNNK